MSELSRKVLSFSFQILFIAFCLLSFGASFQLCWIRSNLSNRNSISNIPKNKIDFKVRSYSFQLKRLMTTKDAINHEETSMVPIRGSKNPIIFFPAQFGTPSDYIKFKEELESRGHPVYILNLEFLDWLQIGKSVFTSDYLQGTLKPKNALGFYFEAVDKALAKCREEYPTRKVHLLAHSIGGWIARSYLGEVISENDRKDLVLSLTTLGSPHASPIKSNDENQRFSNILSNFEQTRGLLSYVNDNFPGAYFEDVKYICVCGRGVVGDIFDRKNFLNIENIVAYASYLPQIGKGKEIGDGIVPESIAFLDGAMNISLEGVKHANFIPNPTKRSIQLPTGYGNWYGSPEIIDKWLIHLPIKV